MNESEVVRAEIVRAHPRQLDRMAAELHDRAAVHGADVEVTVIEASIVVDFNRLDRGVATTTGISASMPMSLALIEAIAGPERSLSVAQDLGLVGWDTGHDSGAFQFTRWFALRAVANGLTFWKREKLGIPLEPGVDEVSQALFADAWSRTYRSRAITFGSASHAQQSRNGIGILLDRVSAGWPVEQLLPSVGVERPAKALDCALEGIAAKYGLPTRDFVAMQLEYGP
jgi:hypothetical protein